MRLLLALLVWFLCAVFTSRGSLVLENLALRQQLATYARGQKCPRLKPQERAFWVALSRVWSRWRSPLLIVKPATVIAWHRRGFRRYWRWKSGKPDRPRIPDEHIAFIRRISVEHPEWGEDRIAEELAIKLGVKHSTSTIRKYMVRRRKPRNGARPSQALHAIPDPYPELSNPPPPNGKLIALPVLGGVQHDYRLAA